MAGQAECHLAPFEGASGADVIANISQTIELVHAHPINDPINNLAVLREFILSGLYEPAAWDEFANSVIPSFVDSLVGGTPDSFLKKRAMGKRVIYDQPSYSRPAITCADSVDADPLLSINAIFNEVVDVTRTVSPSFGAIWPIAWDYCSYWPVRAPERYQGPFNGTYANKILIMGNTYDPATPFFEAQHLAEIMGDQAALVRQDGFGHTSIVESSQCVTDIVTAYLKDGTLPAGTASSPTVCAIDDSVEIFRGVKAVDVRANGTATSVTNGTTPSSTPNGSMGAVDAKSDIYIVTLALTLMSVALDCVLW